MQYTLKFTPLAAAFAEAKSSIERVEKAACEAVIEASGTEYLNGVTSFDVGDQMFIATSYGNGIVFVDTAHIEEGPTISSGPFKGKKVAFPRGDSDDR